MSASLKSQLVGVAMIESLYPHLYGRQPRHYAPHPEAPKPDEEPRWQDERSYEQFGEEEQAYFGSDRR